MAKNPYGTLGPSPGRVAKVNAANKKKPKPTPTPKPRPPLRPRGPVVDPIDAQVKAEFAPLLQALLFERNQKRDYNSRLMHDLGGFTNAVMGKLGGISPMIAGAYDAASQAQQAFGTGYGQALNAGQAADAGRINDVLKTIGAPEGQLASGGDAGGVLAGLAGWIPSQMLATQGGALAGAAANLPQNASVQAQIELHKLMGQAKEDDDAFGNEVTALLSKQPGLRAELRAQAQKENLAAQKLRLDQYNDDRNYWLKMQAYYMSVGKLKLAQQAEKRAQAAEKRYAYETQGRDAYGNVSPNYKQLPNGQIVPRYKPAAPKGKGSTATLTPNAKAEIMQSVLNQEDDIIKKAMPTVWKTSGLEKLYSITGPIVPKKLAAARAKAAKALWERYSARAVTPESKKALRKMIARVIREYQPTSTGSGLTEGLLP